MISSCDGVILVSSYRACMRVYRGRADTIEADRTVSDRIVDWVADEREPAVRVWRPHRQVAFGRRDAREEATNRESDEE